VGVYDPVNPAGEPLAYRESLPPGDRIATVVIDSAAERVYLIRQLTGGQGADALDVLYLNDLSTVATFDLDSSSDLAVDSVRGRFYLAGDQVMAYEAETGRALDPVFNIPPGEPEGFISVGRLRLNPADGRLYLSYAGFDGDQWLAVIHPDTGRTGGAIFGNSPCLMSAWGEEYFRRLTEFFEQTGLDVLEHDGSYPGDLCASTVHPGHEGLLDSQWNQWKRITSFYRWCRARGIYLNVPDWYFLNGSNKTGMGYRETNWSLPRERQILLGRQNIFDGTWQKTPSMGWMFVPLVEYHGGGAAATLEPLSEHLDAYGAHLMQNFTSGVQACYRGPRLFDTDQTKALVKGWVDFYKEHRAILDSDILHVRRADGRDVDVMLHVNPFIGEKGLAVIHNPLERAVMRTIRLPLYYTGLTDTARIREKDGEGKAYALDREYNVEIEVEVPALDAVCLIIE